MKFEFKKRDFEMHTPLRAITFVMMAAFLAGCNFKYEGFTKFTNGCEIVENLSSSELIMIPENDEETIPFTRYSSPNCSVYYSIGARDEKTKNEGSLISFKKISKNTYLGGFFHKTSEPALFHVILNQFEDGKYHLLGGFPTALENEITELVGDVTKTGKIYEVNQIDQIIGLALLVRKTISDPNYVEGQLVQNKSGSSDKKGDDFFFTLTEMPAQSAQPKTEEAPKPSSEDQKFRNKILGTWHCNEENPVPVRKNVHIKWTWIFREDFATNVIVNHFTDEGVIVTFARTMKWSVKDGNMTFSDIKHHYISDTNRRLLTSKQTKATPEKLKREMNSVILDFFPINKEGTGGVNFAFKNDKLIQRDLFECVRFEFEDALKR